LPRPRQPFFESAGERPHLVTAGGYLRGSGGYAHEFVAPAEILFGVVGLHGNALIDRQSAETDPAKRKELVWQIERKLIEDAVRPIIFFMRQGTCWQPEVKGLTLMENSIFNSWRMEDVWLDKN
jgi:hypothetical protein